MVIVLFSSSHSSGKCVDSSKRALICSRPALLSERRHHLTGCVDAQRPPLQMFEPALEEKFEPAVVVPRQRGHNTFLADFAPITFVENVPDTREHSGSPLPESEFGRQIPNIVGGNETFERIAVIAEFIIH